MDKEIITVVSGLPRSGTSMMMKMLEAGGMEILTDNLRKPDDDNPKGYYELERVKQLGKAGDTTWLEEAKGRVVKIISALLQHLPGRYRYKIIFMQRKMEEILASQRQMLIRRGEPADEVSDEEMAKAFSKHLKHVEAWLEEQPNMDVIYVSYNGVLQDPHPHCKRINEFFDNTLDTDRMIKVVDRMLYRQRGS